MPQTPRKSQKYWYRISVETIRVWTWLGVVAAVVVAGLWGYGHLKDYLLVRRVESTLAEGRDLDERLHGEAGLEEFASEVTNGRKSLDEAEVLLEAKRADRALDSAERGRSLLASVYNALRHRGAAGAAQFISVHGDVEFRRGERGGWQQARGRVDLYPGDYVKTAVGASAEIMTLEGTLFTVRPDTVILVDARGSSGPSLERTIGLETGWVDLNTARTASRIATPEAEARISSRSEASVSYDEARRRGRFTSYRGELEVEAKNGSRRQLDERQEIDQVDGRLSQARLLPAAPTALEPTDNLELDLDGTRRLVLAWQPVRGAASYALQVSRSRLFVDNIIEVDGRGSTRATLGVRGEGSFVWRVAATDAEGRRGPWSLPRRFRVTRQTVVPAERVEVPGGIAGGGQDS